LINFEHDIFFVSISADLYLQCTYTHFRISLRPWQTWAYGLWRLNKAVTGYQPVAPTNHDCSPVGISG